jgi:TP901 family phage tail tape measure protein
MSYNSKIQILIEAIDKASATLSNVGTSVSGLSSKIGSLGQTAKIAAGVLLGQLAHDALGALKKAAGSASEGFMDYEKTLTAIIAATDATGAEAEELRNALAKVCEAQTDLGFSAADSARGLQALVKAGMDGSDAARALRSSLSLAALESISTEEAANLLVQTLTMFGLEAEDSAYALNSLSKAADAGIDTASGYASGLANAGAAAHNMGLSLDETLAALIALDKTYGSATESGTYLNAMFKDLVKKSDQLGISLYNQDGTMKSLAEIIEALRGKVKSFGSDQEAVNEYLSVFDVRAQRAVIGLLNYDGTIEDTMANMESSRSVQDKMNMVLETTAGKLSKAQAEMENASYSLGEMTSQMSVTWTKFSAGLGPIGSVANALGPSLLQGAITGLMVMLPTIISSMGGLSGVMTAVGTASTAMLGPIGLVIAAVGLLATAYATNFLGIRDKIDGFIAWLGPAWNNMVSTLTTAWQNFWNGAKAFVQDPVGTIQTAVTTLATNMETKFTEIYDQTGNIWKATWETLKTIPVVGAIVSAVEGLGNQILGAFGVSMDDVFNVWQGAWQSIQDFIHDPIGTIQNGVTAFGDYMKNSFNEFTGKVNEAFGGMLTAMEEDYPKTTDFIKNVQSGFNALITGDWYSLGQSIRETVQSFLPAVQEVWNTTLENIKSFAGNAWTWLKDNFSSGLNAINTFFTDTCPKIANTFVTALTDIKDRVVEWVASLPQKFKEGLTALINAVLDWGPRILDGFKNTLNSIVTAISDFFRGLIGWSIWTDGLNSMLNVWRDIWNSTVNFLGGPISAIQNAVAGFSNNVAGKFEETKNYLTNVWNNAWSAIQTTANNISNNVKSTVASWSNNVAGKFEETKSYMGTVWNNAWSSIQSTATSFASKASTWGSNLASNIGSGISGKVSSVVSTVGSLGSSISSKFSGYISSASSWGSSMLSNFISGVKSKVSSLTSTLSSIAGTVSSWLGFGSVPEKGPLHDLLKWGPALTEQFAEGILSELPKVTEAAGNVAGAFSEFDKLKPPRASLGGAFPGGFAQPGGLQFNAPLVVIQGDASEDTAKLAADLILKNMRKYVAS